MSVIERTNSAASAWSLTEPCATPKRIASAAHNSASASVRLILSGVTSESASERTRNTVISKPDDKFNGEASAAVLPSVPLSRNSTADDAIVPLIQVGRTSTL